MASSAHGDTVQPRSLTALWLGILGPPALWLTQFEIKYALAGVGQASRHTPALIATSVIAAALVLLLGYLTVRLRQIAYAAPLDAHAGVTSRNRFMATLGLMSCGMFLLIILAQAIADFFFQPGVT